MRRVLVVGTGLIGTSIALALRRRGHEVCLRDANDEHLRHAERLGAGRRHAGEDVDLAVVAVPPDCTAAVVAQVLRRQPRCTVTDTASIKQRVQSDLDVLLSSHARDAPADAAGVLPRYVGGHPIAGRERQGPFSAHPELFAGRPWVLTPSSVTAGAAVDDASWLAGECGASAMVMSAEQHDRGLAVTSHLPQLVASALAAQLATQSDSVLALVGQGLRDTTRLATSDPRLWAAIAAGNADALAAAVEGFTATLAGVARALRAETARSSDAVRALLENGRAGQRRMPGKHGGAPRSYEAVPVVVPDQPGELARLLGDAAAAGANVEDLRVEHAPGLPVGVIELFVGPDAVASLRATLGRRGWTILAGEPTPQASDE